MKPLVLACVLFAACGRSAPRRGSAATSPAKGPSRPDVVLVTVDTMRADHLSSYGYGRPTSPYLDVLAAEGVRFANVIAQGSWTFSAIPALVTSEFPQAHTDLWVRGRGGAARLSEASKTLAEHLKGLGYRTSMVSGHGGFGAIVGLPRGFDTFIAGRSGAREVTDRAIGLLRAAPADAPHLLWVHYMDPHTRYAPPPPYDTRFVDDGRLVTGTTLAPVDSPFLGVGGIPQRALLGERRDLDFYVSRYDGEIAYVDSQLQRLFAAAHRPANPNGTIIAVTADHGESLGEGGLYFAHTAHLHAAILSIPWILSFPGQPRGGRVVQSQVMAVDIAPTIADLVGAPAPPRWEGRSLAECLRSDVPCESRDAFATRGVESAIKNLLWKLICAEPDGACQLYDLRTDPTETTDVAAAHLDVVARLRTRLEAWRAAHPDPRPRASWGAIVEMDPATEAELRSLGYVE